MRTRLLARPTSLPTALARSLVTTLAVAPLAALALAAPAGAAPAPFAAAERIPAAKVPLLAGPAAATPTSVSADLAARAPKTATFRVTYTGFSPTAKAAFQRAVDIWSTQVVSDVPITVDAEYRPLGPGVLGAAGPDSLYRDFPGAPRKDTFYVDALVNKHYGSDAVDTPDISADFSSSFRNWHFGTGPAPAGTYDFTSVVMHEIGHGLGFLGAGYVQGGLGTVRFQGGDGKTSPSSYDRFTETAAGKALLSFPDPSAALKTQLTSGALFFDSPAVRSANGGKPARLYAPGTWQSGSSYSHLDESTFRAGSANSLMTPMLGTAETVRTPGPVTKALFTSIGW